MRFTNKLLFGLVITALSWSASAAMYKWVDEQGNVHYSQQRPSAQQYQTVAPPPGPSSSAAEERERLKSMLESRDQSKEEATKAEAEAAADQAEKERFRKNCEAARRNLETYQNLGRKKVVGSDGVAYYPDEEEVAEKIATARKNIQEYCQ